jgi:hypothetical protein
VYFYCTNVYLIFYACQKKSSVSISFYTANKTQPRWNGNCLNPDFPDLWIKGFLIFLKQDEAETGFRMSAAAVWSLTNSRNWSANNIPFFFKSFISAMKKHRGRWQEPTDPAGTEWIVNPFYLTPTLQMLGSEIC